jgi:transcriptional regulator with XRE-family HTH domain
MRTVTFDTSPQMQLRLARIGRKMDQFDLAALLGVSQTTASRIETGRQLPSLRQAVKLEQKFGIPPAAWITKRKKSA